MKKVLVALLFVLLALCFVSCGGNDAGGNPAGGGSGSGSDDAIIASQPTTVHL